jgi:hypothetical protein
MKVVRASSSTALLCRGPLEELEKAHIYIARMSDTLKRQQNELTVLSARVEALPAS